jgi:pentatricopeptide repeat protein
MLARRSICSHQNITVLFSRSCFMKYSTVNTNAVRNTPIKKIHQLGLVAKYVNERRIDKIEEFAQASLHDIGYITTLMKAFLTLNKVDRAYALFEKYKYIGFDQVAMNAILRGCASTGHVDKMETILHDMTQAGMQPDANTLLTGYFAAKQFQKGMECLKSMNVVPDEQVICTAIKQFGATRQIQDAEYFIHTFMPEHNIPLTTNIVEQVLRAYQNNGMMEKAKEYFDSVPDDLRTCHIYTIMLRQYNFKKMILQTEQLYDEMLERGVKPDGEVVTEMVTGYVSQGLPLLAVAFYEEAVQKYGINSKYAKIHVLYAYSSLGDMVKARAIFYSEYLKSEDGYLALLRGYFNKLNIVQIDRILQTMRDSKFNGVKMYNEAIRGFLSIGKFERAETLLHEMIGEKNIRPDNSLVEYIGKAYTHQDHRMIYQLIYDIKTKYGFYLFPDGWKPKILHGVAETPSEEHMSKFLQKKHYRRDAEKKEQKSKESESAEENQSVEELISVVVQETSSPMQDGVILSAVDTEIQSTSAKSVEESISAAVQESIDVPQGVMQPATEETAESQNTVVTEAPTENSADLKSSLVEKRRYLTEFLREHNILMKGARLNKDVIAQFLETRNKEGLYELNTPKKTAEDYVNEMYSWCKSTAKDTWISKQSSS